MGAQRACINCGKVNPPWGHVNTLGGAPGRPGAHDQYEPCMQCGTKLLMPSRISLIQKSFFAPAYQLNHLQGLFVKPRPNVIHMVFRKKYKNRHQ